MQDTAEFSYIVAQDSQLIHVDMTGYLTYLNLRFLIFKMGLMTEYTSQIGHILQSQCMKSV
jgi:hypothetical protein